ncbi:MAG: 6,7-dimethyl-8-ribityllumazine synthase [Actinomycetota bacterium]
MSGGMVPGGEPIQASDFIFAVVVSRFNEPITSRLLDGAQRCFAEHGGPTVDVFTVPGAFELPLGAALLADTDRYDAIVALGCVIRGETPHFEFIAAECARGLQEVALDEEIPITFGVLTTENAAQADARSGAGRDNKGWEAARSAIEMAVFVADLELDEEEEPVEPIEPVEPVEDEELD